MKVKKLKRMKKRKEESLRQLTGLHLGELDQLL